MAEGTRSHAIAQLPANDGFFLTEYLNDITKLRAEVTSLLYLREQRLYSLYTTHQQQLDQSLTFQLQQAMDRLIWHVQRLQSTYSSPVLNNPSFQLQIPSRSPWENQLAPFKSVQTPQLHPIEIDFPHFAEGDPTDWIFKIECIFTYFRVPPHERLLLASFHLEQPAFCWYQCLEKHGSPVLDWASFVDAIFERFDPLDSSKYFSRLKIQQPKSIEGKSTLARFSEDQLVKDTALNKPWLQLPTNNGSSLTEYLNDITELRAEVTSLLYQHEQRLYSLYPTQQQQQEQRLTFELQQAMDQLIWNVQRLQSDYSSPVLNNPSFQLQTSSRSPWENQLAHFKCVETPQLCPIELKIPRFAEGDPTEWIFKVECIFTYYRVLPHERFLLAALHLDRPAICWYRCLEKFGSPVLDWASFVDAIYDRFGPLDILRSKYISRLKPKIHQSVLTEEPKSIEGAFTLARLSEDQLVKDTALNKPRFQQICQPNPKPTLDMPPPHSLPSPSQLSKLPIRCLSSKEIQQHYENDLCFICDDKFVKGHKCKVRPTLLYLDHFEELEGIDEVQQHSQDTLEFEFRISFNWFMGNLSSKLLCIMGDIAGQSVQVLIDTESTHNFITDKLLRHLHLPISTIKGFFVEVGNEDAVKCNGACYNTILDIKGNEFPIDLFVLQQKGKYVILGLQWLETLGDILINYSPLSMSFQWHGSTIRLQ